MFDPTVIVVSGGMGTCGDQLARTALVQFPDVDVPIEVVALVRTEEEVTRVINKAADRGGLIVHTLVDSDLRSFLISAAEERGVTEIDTIGPVLDYMSDSLHRSPLGTPGLYRKLREEYFRMVEAIDFAVSHDDGRRFQELHLADIVLIGSSRVGKTPLSMYLAMRGHKTANVPLVRDIDPPDELFEIDRARVVGLSVEPERLTAFRRRRQAHLGAKVSKSYSDPKEVFQDLEYARNIFRRGRFTILDVSDKPIEESANEVVALVTRQGGFK